MTRPRLARKYEESNLGWETQATAFEAGALPLCHTSLFSYTHARSPTRTRTWNRLINNELLCRLSYRRLSYTQAKPVARRTLPSQADTWPYPTKRRLALTSAGRAGIEPTEAWFRATLACQQTAVHYVIIPKPNPSRVRPYRT